METFGLENKSWNGKYFLSFPVWREVTLAPCVGKEACKRSFWIPQRTPDKQTKFLKNTKTISLPSFSGHSLSLLRRVVSTKQADSQLPSLFRSFEHSFFFKCLFITFIFGGAESLLLCVDFLLLRRAGTTLWWQRFSLGGVSCCGTQVLGHWAAVVVAPGLSCTMTCGGFPDQGLSLCPLHWQVDSTIGPRETS